ncbi:GlpM family protein [Aeromonas simiae]|uniref:GlpM family protein n=1 Tax=Aeromonas simiae TaxID=218936 RepID=UPI0005A82B96|nr:GlpM family protein [Aeromonas simiae]MDO2948022.1 GlpM family protein [Aeromonas simiae]MDO2952273.1 GlpM family protein [Aeromonas simiae]MDO2955405.1 GlpM family protein [Aeromonas simiae]
MIPLLLKSSLGALAVLLIALLSQSRHAMLAGLVPLFPTFALIAHAIVGRERGPALLQGTALFGLAALLPYALYLLAVWYLSVRTSLTVTLLSATLIWTLAAGLLIWGWGRLA